VRFDGGGGDAYGLGRVAHRRDFAALLAWARCAATTPPFTTRVVRELAVTPPRYVAVAPLMPHQMRNQSSADAMRRQ
jgi:hypothetical protein